MADTGYRFSCRRCGYDVIFGDGVRFGYPVVYRKILDSAKSGRLGEDLRQFLSEHPEGVLDCGTVLLKCERCGILKTGPSLAMYLPKREGVRLPEDWPAPYDGEPADPCSLEEDYTLHARHEYSCHKCGRIMEMIDGKAAKALIRQATPERMVKELVCPECGKELYYGRNIIWD